MHKLKKDNRVYIGITCQKPEKRWQNGLGYTHSSYFYNAIIKYGWDNFEHIILFKGLTKKEAEIKEKDLIKKYKANVKGYGFNINEGGFAPVITEEQKQKISSTEKGKVVPKKVGNKISQTKKERFSKFGLTEKQREFYKKRSKPIICLETGKIYQNQRDLKENGFNAGNIQQVCVGKKITAAGFHWQYYKEN